MKLTNNTILITGGGTGIGLAMAKMFLQHGNRVAVCGRRQDKLDSACEKHADLKAYCCDVSDELQRQQLHDALITDGIEPNVLINNAAVMRTYNLVDTENLDAQQMQHDLEINLLAPINMIKLFLPLLKSQSEPVIINVTSPGGVVPVASLPIYCASKAALDSYTKSLRYQLQGQVEVIDVYPPSVDTDMMQGVDLRTVSVDQFTKDLLACLKKGGDSHWIGEGKYLKWINYIAPGFAYRLVNKSTKVSAGADTV